MNYIQNKKIKFWSIISALLLFTMIMISIFSEPNIQNIDLQFQKPSLQFLFGTDQFGRDIFLRSVQGFVSVFFLALFISIISFILSLILGTFLGYYGGIFDEIFFYIFNFLQCFPMMILIIMLAAFFGPKIETMIIIMIISGTITRARLIRAEVIIQKNNDFILALKILGASDKHIIFHHLLPIVTRMVLPQASILLGHIILSISGYSFLGFGVTPPKADIGLIMQESIRFINIAPWTVICPGALQFLAIMCFTQLAEAIMKITAKRQLKHIS